MAERVRVAGDLFHGRIPEGAIYVGRAAPGLKASPYANPHSIGGTNGCRMCSGRIHDLDEALWLYEQHLDIHPDLVAQARRELAGRDLACWCAMDQRCHVDILLWAVSREPCLTCRAPGESACVGRCVSERLS